VVADRSDLHLFADTGLSDGLYFLVELMLNRVGWLAFVLALAPSLLLIFFALRPHHAAIGPQLLLSLPVVFTVVPLLWPTRPVGLTCTLLLAGVMVITVFSAGVLYTPALVALVFSIPDRQAQRPGGSPHRDQYGRH
jgi:hypothetical protein